MMDFRIWNIVRSKYEETTECYSVWLYSGYALDLHAPAVAA